MPLDVLLEPPDPELVPLPALELLRCRFDPLLRCERVPVMLESLPAVDELPIESVPVLLEPALPEPVLPVLMLPEPVLPVVDPLCPLPAPVLPPAWAVATVAKPNAMANTATL